MRKAELLQKREGRPTHITDNGWTVFISIRDAEYERQMKGWRGKLKAAHPDCGGTHYKFLAMHRTFVRWRKAEADWYAQYDLTPPDGWRGAAVLLNRRRRLKGLVHGTEE